MPLAVVAPHFLVLLVALPALVACSGRHVRDADGSPDSGAADGGTGDADSVSVSDADADADADRDTPDAERTVEVDILLVVDDSASMEEEQSALAAAIPSFAQRLEEHRTEAGERLDYRIGITSTSADDLDYELVETVKQGWWECEAGDECARSYLSCECPALGFAPCSTDCPGSCFCEPPGTTTTTAIACEGHDGALVAPPGSADPWLEGPGAHISSILSDAVALGTRGCDLEMPLRAMEHALSPTHQAATGAPNAGFRRAGPLLFVVVLTDEDDCSSELRSVVTQETIIDVRHPMASPNDDGGCTDDGGLDVGDQYQPVERYIDFLDELTAGRACWALAVIAAPSRCESALGEASPAHRLLRLVESAGPSNAVLSDICGGDLAGPLDDAFDLLAAAASRGCGSGE